MKSGRVLFYQMTILFCFAHPSPVSRKIVMAAIMDFLRARRKTLNFKGWGEKKIRSRQKVWNKMASFSFCPLFEKNHHGGHHGFSHRAGTLNIRGEMRKISFSSFPPKSVLIS
jgi:hypothetical protein